MERELASSAVSLSRTFLAFFSNPVMRSVFVPLRASAKSLSHFSTPSFLPASAASMSRVLRSRPSAESFSLMYSPLSVSKSFPVSFPRVPGSVPGLASGALAAISVRVGKGNSILKFLVSLWLLRKWPTRQRTSQGWDEVEAYLQSAHAPSNTSARAVQIHNALRLSWIWPFLAFDLFITPSEERVPLFFKTAHAIPALQGFEFGLPATHRLVGASFL